MRDDIDFPGEDPLDRLLGGAEWPEPDPLRLARLQHALDRALARRQQRRRRIRVALAAAAVFSMTALGLWWVSAGAPRDKLVAPAEPPQQHAPAVAEANPQPPPPEADPRDRNMHWLQERGLAPSAYELLVLRAKENRQKATRDDPLQRAVQALAAAPDADIDQLVARLMPRRAVYEGRLLRSISDAGGEQLIAQITVLAAIGSSRSVPLLAQLSRPEATRSVAMEGLRRLADSAALAKLAAAEPDEQLRREFLAILLDRGDPASLAFFLDTVRDPRSTASALAVFESSANPPIDSLIAFLSGTDAERRATAAGLLGRLDHPGAVIRLIELVKNDMTRQPALMALLASDDPQARRFLAGAWNHPQMHSALQLAQLQWQIAAWHVSVPELPEVH